MTKAILAVMLFCFLVVITGCTTVDSQVTSSRIVTEDEFIVTQ